MGLLAGASVTESTKILVLEKNNAEMILMMESFNINVSISVKDERENLMKRIEVEKQQLEIEKEQKDLNERIEQLNKRVQDTNKALLALRKEMEEEKRKITIEKQNLSNILQCPVCLDTCKPPLQIWQCREGHILCESCYSRRELKSCPQCRMSLQGNVSRSRVLEELAIKLFPHKVRTPRESSYNCISK